MLDLLNRCFKNRMNEWEPRLKQIIPSYGQSLGKNEQLAKQIREYTSKELGLQYS